MGRIIGVVSLKGGVGKTSTVASLGAAMASLGKKVLLVDGNFTAPNLGLHLDVIEPEKTVHDLLDGKVNLNDVIYHLDNFDLIPASASHKSEVNYLKLKDKLRPLKKKYDAILVDSSPSLNQETLGVMLASDFILVVTTPDYPTLSNTLKAVRLAKQRDTPIGGLVINRVYGKDFELSLEDIENVSGVPVLAVIPHDVRVMKSVADAIPYPTLKPHAKGAKEYRRLAGVLVGEKESFKFRNLFGWINPSKQDVNREIFYDRVFG